MRAYSGMTPLAGNRQVVDPRAAKSSGSRWYAVQCQPHRECVAARQLENQGLVAFLPLREKTRRHARKIETVQAPFFPGYLFVELDLTRDPWRSVNGTLGVVRIVGAADAPTPVPRGIVETMQLTCGQGGVMAYRPELEPGQPVRVLNGPFADLMGQLEQLTDSGRVRVLLDIMGGRASVLLPRDNLVPAASSF